MRITLTGSVGLDITATALRPQLAAAKGGPIDIDLASPGGYVDEGLLVYNLLRDYRGRKTVRLVGLVASAATLFACAADRVKALPTSLFMVHGSSLSVAGNASDLQQGAETLRKYDALLATVYAEKTGKPLDEIRALMDEETWYTPEEALAAGFVDEIEGSTAVPHADLESAKAQYRAVASRGHREGELERAAAFLGTPCPGFSMLDLSPEEREDYGRFLAFGYSIAVPTAQFIEDLKWFAMGVSSSARASYLAAGGSLRDAQKMDLETRKLFFSRGR